MADVAKALDALSACEDWFDDADLTRLSSISMRFHTCFDNMLRLREMVAAGWTIGVPSEALGEDAPQSPTP